MGIIGTSIVVSFSNAFIMFYLFLKIGHIMKIKFINSLKKFKYTCLQASLCLCHL
jgi:hypothetical protein